MNRLFKKALCAGVALSLLAVVPTRAGVNDSMDDFWGDSVTAANVTGPTAYQGQRMGYYTMGSLSYRAPQENTQIATVQLPSMRAGCGGIDIFSGGFSFINTDQLIANLKAIASNAEGYVFLLAMKMLSPMIANQMETLQDWVQKVNAMNINSCEAAQQLVDGAWQKIDAGSKHLCQALANEDGTYSDPIAARHGCSKNTASNLTNQSSDPNAKAVIPINTNLAWEAVKKNPFLQSEADLGELMMTLTGTVIYQCPTGNDGSCRVTIMPAAARDQGLINKFIDGGTISAHRCNDTTSCLAPVAFNKAINISVNSSFKKKVGDMLSNIAGKIAARQPLTPAEQNFLGMTSLPVAKMLAVHVAHEKALAPIAVAQYSEIVALDLTYTWVAKMINEVEKGAANLQNVDTSQTEAWRRSMADIRAELLEKQGQLSTRTSAMQAMVANTQAMEAVLSTRIANRVGSAVAFSSSMKTY
ncbi:conjugal transfer protein TraH [Caulobacter sp. 17J65-9]|uniref:conjugal transfer protein TraH n=1 Tax=Caulobacter sp. 17J65-9 TaxID=2709382 RepID=UPI0013CD9CF3|nr:conjugal transfer protein TraH [Caulobacter sp. 17J65-9]NEX91204.1 conjugal transfer protein TraH [Caulobacter sp. 17J65-9]